ncbi:MAG: RNase J family beta-CASP ribonuclease [Lachnospiraceae bacterium]|nr:RNase J family beta-CASP ribonuclease [Lachnospiraceae bacterium]
MSKYSINPLLRLKEVGKKATEAAGAGKKSDAGKKNKEKKTSKSVPASKKSENKQVKQQDKTSKKQTVKTETKSAAKSSPKSAAKPESGQMKKTADNRKAKQVQKQEPKPEKKQGSKASADKKPTNLPSKAATGQEQKYVKDVPKKSGDPAAKQPKTRIEVSQAEKNRNIVPVSNNKTVKIIPLGGLEQIGMNITAFEYEDSIIVVDCGMTFPTEDMPGIDLVIPDVTYLKENEDKVKAFFVTHGHEDHIGAFPYVLRNLNVPVYGNRLSLALIEHKLQEAGLLESAHLRTVKYGDVIKAGDFKVEFIKTNHSIPDSAALAIFSPAGVIFHTGDFKIDYTPIFGDPANLQRMAEIGDMGCLALLCDSTNAPNAGSTASEKTVGRKIEIIFSEHKDQRFIVASFASNVDRVQQIINVAHKFGRKVIVEGKSMSNILEIATRLGYISIPEGTLVDVENLKNYRPEDTVIITTGSQGESMAALSRMAAGTHKKVIINDGDVVVMSSKTIPGNEKAVARVINELYMKGAEVEFHDTHVSGHACEEDIKLIYALLKPKYAIPIHGDYMHLVAQKQIAIDMGMSSKKVRIIGSGDVLEVGDNKCEVIDHVEAGPVFVEGTRVGDVGDMVIKDRQYLSQNGIIITSVAMQDGSGEIVGGPDIVTRGFIYEKENGDIIDELETVVKNRLNSLNYRGIDENKIKIEMKDALKSYLIKKYKKTPVIMPIVTMVNI